MEPKDIRAKFIEIYGYDKYKELVLSLYQSFPLINKLAFWQEQLLNNLSSNLNRQNFKISEIFSIFNHCPIHDQILKEDIVPIVDGNSYQVELLFETEIKLRPFANTIAPRNLNFGNFPKELKVYYCPDCRKVL